MSALAFSFRLYPTLVSVDPRFVPALWFCHDLPMHKFIAGVLLLFAVEARAGYWQFTWYGDTGFFHGGFDITDREWGLNTVSNSDLTSSLFFSSMRMTDAFGFTLTNGFGNLYIERTPYNGDLLHLGVGFGPTNIDYYGRVFGCNVINSAPMFVSTWQGTGYFGSITTEAYIQDGTSPTFIEYGYWRETFVVPEPSIAAVCAVGAGVYAVRRRNRHRAPAP
jgi:hypothetical protein